MVTSTRKIEANRRNAQLSTGPRDTTRTKYNATKHGLFAGLPKAGEEFGWEARREFEQLRQDIWGDRKPQGMVEEIWVQQMAECAWSLRQASDCQWAIKARRLTAAVKEWEEADYQRSLFRYEGQSKASNWEYTSDLKQDADFLSSLLQALDHDDPLSECPGLWFAVFDVATKKFHLQIRKTLKLKRPWSAYQNMSKHDVDVIIHEVCSTSQISEDLFWSYVRDQVEIDYGRAKGMWEDRAAHLGADGVLFDEADLEIMEKVQRQCTAAARGFGRAQEKLEELQAARRRTEAA